MSVYEHEAELKELRRRVEILERYVAISMLSSRSYWNRHQGLGFNSGANDEVTNMIMGNTSWDPESLDNGG